MINTPKGRILHTFQQFIAEGRDAPLYHASGIESAMAIVKTNKILPLTTHHGNSVPGCSVTRSLKTAANWSAIIFQLDQTKLVHNHKLKPLNIQHKWRGKEMPHAKYEELFEEFIPGGIMDLKKYLVRVIADMALLRRWRNNAESNYNDPNWSHIADHYKKSIDLLDYWLNYPGIVDLKSVVGGRRVEASRVVATRII